MTDCRTTVIVFKWPLVSHDKWEEKGVDDDDLQKSSAARYCVNKALSVSLHFVPMFCFLLFQICLY